MRIHRIGGRLSVPDPLPGLHLAEEGARLVVPLSLSALSLDLIIALAQRPHGVSASELARVVGGAPTSVQSSLRLLTDHGLVTRGGGARYRLSAQHPAAADAVALALRLAAPDAATRLVLRASDSVEFAVVDETSFVVGTRADAEPDSRAALDSSLATIRRDRPDVPPVLRFETEELRRILRSALALRRRVTAGEVVKGVLRPAGPSAASAYPRGPGSFTRTS